MLPVGVYHARGSSPRLRGTLLPLLVLVLLRRFIPAPAGNTVLWWLLMSPSAVHPRACGEHLATGFCFLGRGGSSPRLRGTPLQQYAQDGLKRFIPAPAGNTQRGAVLKLGITVHPRACGEHTSAFCMLLKSFYRPKNSTENHPSLLLAKKRSALLHPTPPAPYDSYPM